MGSPTVLLVGLDAADPGLLLEWTNSGLMPNLKSIRDQGVWGRLETPPGLGDDAVWASFSTACGPARHGRFFHRQPVPGSYSSLSFREADVEFDPFWSYLSNAGARVAVLDVPKSPLVHGLNGVQLSDWRVHGRDGPTRSWPSELSANILDAFGDDDTDQYPDYLCGTDSLPREILPDFVDRLLTSVDRKADASIDILVRDHWDLFLVVFKEAHCVSHQCWHLVDEKHPAFDEDLARELEQPVQRVFVSLDRALGEILENVSDGTTVIVFSSLGMKENTTGEHLLESILLRLEPRRFFSIWQRLHDRVARRQSSRFMRLQTAMHKRLMPYRTAFHVKHNEASGAVRLNLAGREPRGRVAPSQKEAALDRLEEELLKITDSASGSRVVRRVLRTHEEFAGQGSDRLGDLLVEWSSDAGFESVYSPTIGRLDVQAPSWRTGNHVPGGVFFARGPAIDASGDALTASIVDVGPTIAAILGHQMSDVDGRPIASVSKPDKG